MPNYHPNMEGLERHRAETPKHANIGVTIPAELLERVDAARDRPRSQVVAEALKMWLERG